MTGAGSVGAGPAAADGGIEAAAARNGPRERLTAALDPEQRAAVTACMGALSVVAGAGAGKTRVLTHRAAWMAAAEGVAPERLLAVAFTNQAVDEMRGRLRQLIGAEAAAAIECATFHAAAWRLVVRRHARRYPRPVRVIYSTEDSLSAARRALKTARVDLRPREALARIGRAKAHGLGPAELARRGAADRAVAAVWVAYRDELRAAGALDFGDLLCAAVWLMDHDEQVRAALQGRFHGVLVDEYQDASPIQRRFVELLAAGDRANVTVVGDEDQAIYRFTGGDARGLREFPGGFANGRVVVLGRNYRSRHEIVTCAARLIAHNPKRPAKDLRGAAAGGEVELRRFADADEEAEAVAEWVAERLELGTPASELCVLARTGRYLRGVEQRLASRWVPYVVLGRLRLAEHAEVRDVLALVAAARYPYHREAVRRAARRVRGLGVATLERVFREARAQQRSPVAVLLRAPDELEAAIKGAGRAGCGELGERIGAVSERLGEGLAAGVAEATARSGWAAELHEGDGEEPDARGERLNALHALAARLDAEGSRDAEELLMRLVLDGGERPGEGVTLATIHAAKGREWDRVGLIGCHEGHLPHAHAIQAGAGEIASERCVAYVAMTRARVQLLVTAPEKTGRPPRPTPLSRFVREAGLP